MQRTRTVTVCPINRCYSGISACPERTKINLDSLISLYDKTVTYGLDRVLCLGFELKT